jgi:hypothetical protein
MMSAPENSVKRSFFTVGNFITAIIFLVGAWLTYLRFSGGLAAVTTTRGGSGSALTCCAVSPSPPAAIRPPPP